MSVIYKLVKSKGNIPNNSPFRVITKAFETKGMDHLQQRIRQATSLTPADVVSAVTALKEEIAEQLKMGNNVHLPGIGYFSIAATGELYQDPRSKHYRLRNPRVRTVNFRPDTLFMEALEGITFENGTYRNTPFSDTDDHATDATLKALFAHQSFITVGDLRAHLNLSQSSAYRLAARLVEEGRLRNAGTPYRKMFVKGDGNTAG